MPLSSSEATDLRKFGDLSLTGSKAICPELKPNDEDWIFYTFDEAELKKVLLRWGFTEVDETSPVPVSDEEGNSYPIEMIHSRWKRDDCDILVFSGDEGQFGFDLWLLATKVGKALHLTRRQDRITLFHAILYRRYKT